MALVAFEALVAFVPFVSFEPFVPLVSFDPLVPLVPLAVALAVAVSFTHPAYGSTTGSGGGLFLQVAIALFDTSFLRAMSVSPKVSGQSGNSTHYVSKLSAGLDYY